MSNEIINDFLETEINDFSKDYFLGKAKEYKNQARKNRIELTGNAYNISIFNTTVIIENLWDNSISPVEIHIDEYINYIEKFY